MYTYPLGLIVVQGVKDPTNTFGSKIAYILCMIEKKKKRKKKYYMIEKKKKKSITSSDSLN